MKLITNHTSKKHGETTLDLLRNADEAWLATAFLKSSGLSKLLSTVNVHVASNKPITIVAGQNFALTEPKSLYTLRSLFEGSESCRLFLAHAEKPKEIFHPKLFLFRKGEKGYIISGSSNITEGGLSSNFECSLLVETVIEEPIWQEALDYFNILCSPRVSQPATLFVIKQYETYFESQKKHNAQSKVIPEKTEKQIQFNYENLHKHFLAFNTANREQLLTKRIAEYTEAREVLNKIASDRLLTKERFSQYLDRLVGAKGTSKLWHSGSLFRLRGDVYPYYKEFRELVRFIKTNQRKPVAEIFDGAKSIVKRIRGAAANYIAEIMMTYNPSDCANINRNPITVLREAGGVKLKSHSSLFNGGDYSEYCIIIKDISQMLTLKNMLEADSFFNEIYWKIYKRVK